jgi:hypothetical protein
MLRAAWACIPCAVLLAALAACTQTRWDNPAADPARAAADQSECEQSANLAARQQVMFERLSGPRPVRNGVIGYPTMGGGPWERNSEWAWTQRFFDQCMRSKGYRLVRVE